MNARTVRSGGFERRRWGWLASALGVSGRRLCFVGIPGKSLGGSVERSGVECRGRVGCAARPLEKPERAWRRRSRVSQLDLVVLPLFPRLLTSSPCPPGREAWRHLHPEPQTLESRFSGSAPSGRVLGWWELEGTGRVPVEQD